MPDPLASLVMAANSSAPAPAPIPDDTEDVVEAYSFNTGTFLWLPSTMHAFNLRELQRKFALYRALDGPAQAGTSRCRSHGAAHGAMERGRAPDSFQVRSHLFLKEPWAQQHLSCQ